MIPSEAPHRAGRAYERRCEINGLKAAAKVFAVYLIVSYPLSRYVASVWPMLVFAGIALVAMLIAYLFGSIYTPWLATDDAEAYEVERASAAPPNHDLVHREPSNHDLVHREP